MPSQKFGVDSPHSANRFAPTSHAVSFFTAEITPAGMPIRSAMRNAIEASCSVTGSFSSDEVGDRPLDPHRLAEVAGQRRP